MGVGTEAEALVGLADRLCAALGYSPATSLSDEAPSPGNDPRHNLFGTPLGPEQERLALLARQCLHHLAAALGISHEKMVSESTYEALLDGAETTMRSELAAGVPIASVMPSLVFLVALPMVGDEEALRLSRRTASLLGEAQGPGEEPS